MCRPIAQLWAKKPVKNGPLRPFRSRRSPSPTGSKINLCAFEGELFGRKLIIRGSLERLTPVLMAALVAAFALIPLLLSADAPGKEILHPVAVVIFGGLVSSTLLDTVVTPLMLYVWGERPLARLLAARQSESF